MANPQAPKSGILLGRELSAAVVLFHQAIADRLGLSTTEWKCIDILLRSGPTTAKQLAELAGLTTGGVTGVVDRLERAGYVERLANPDDRRSVIIHLHAGRLPEGKAGAGPIVGALGAAMYKLATQYSPAELGGIEPGHVGVTEVLTPESS